MGARKRIKADKMKEARKNIAFAKLNNCPTSPRKMRLIADLIRGMEVEKALSELKHNPKEASNRMEKLLLSALANWESKNEGKNMDEHNLYVSEVKVDGGRMLKRIQPVVFFLTFFLHQLLLQKHINYVRPYFYLHF